MLLFFLIFIYSKAHGASLTYVMSNRFIRERHPLEDVADAQRVYSLLRLTVKERGMRAFNWTSDQQRFDSVREYFEKNLDPAVFLNIKCIKKLMEFSQPMLV
ncbi:MAG: hypothetical protein OXC30_00550 [Alphaproteobacteria bacterium]|nr:hypothetical protein [Alphaproteobacteria bacterium]